LGSQGPVRKLDDLQTSFVLILEKYPLLLQKSQIPSLKQKKKADALEFISTWQATSGDTLTIDKLHKKLSNMKNRVKSKSDINKTGNKTVKLLDWEKKFLALLAEKDNPTIVKIPVE
jgi:hypothetical protein